MLSRLHSITAVLFAVLMITALNHSSYGAAPSSINYQGILTDSSGDPEVGTFSVTFAIYGLSFGGTPLWSETQNITTDAQGRFSVVLGELTPLDNSYFGVGTRFLGITISPDAEMVPRQQIHSMAYSLRTQTLDGASGGQVFGNIDLSGEIQALGMSSKIRFHYDLLVDLPDPTTFHGAIAHVHETGYLYYAHGGEWVPLANQSDVTSLSSLSAPDGTPDPAVDVDNDGNVQFVGELNGAVGPLVVGANGLIVNGQLAVNGLPVNFNALMNINNGAQVIGGDLNILGPRILAILNGARLLVQNAGELELEAGAQLVARTSAAVHFEAAVDWTSSAPLYTEAEIEIETPGYLQIQDNLTSDKSTLELDRLEINKGLRLMVLRPEDLSVTGGQFDLNAPKFVVNTPVPVEMVSLSLTGAPGLSVSGGGGVAVTGGGTLMTDPASQLQVNGPSTFAQPINAPLQVGVGPGGAGALHVVGNITATGAKLFVQDHPYDPSKQIQYIALEAGEAGTYTRGSALLEGGAAVIQLPEHFSLVTSQEGLTAQITPRGPVHSMLYIESLSSTQLVVKSSNKKDSRVNFDYLVNGVRVGFEKHQPIVDRERFTSE